MSRKLLPFAIACTLAPPSAMAHEGHRLAQAAPEAPTPSAADEMAARITALEATVAALQEQIAALKGETPVPPDAPPTPPEEPFVEPVAPSHGHTMGSGGTSFGNLTVSGMVETQFTTAIGGSLRQPVFGRNKNTDFLLTHVHPMLYAQLGEKAAASAMWCLTHMGQTAVYEAYLEYVASDALSLKMGRVLLPFGAWNPISNPTQFPSVSRPLMYLGHEERNIVPEGGPRPMLNDEDSEIGLFATGQTEQGQALLSYAAWVSNGKHNLYQDFQDGWIDFRPSEDNNSRKSLGGRIAATTGPVTLGASYTGGKWDAANQHDYRIWALDATYRGPDGLTVRAEYASNPVDRPENSGGNLTRHGWYVMADRPVGKKWSANALYSTLTERPAANVETMSRATVGLNYRLADSVTLKTELGRLFMGSYSGDPDNAPFGTEFDDVTTLKFATVVSF